MGSSSSSATQSTTQYNTETNNSNVQGNTGPVLSGLRVGGDSTVNFTDDNAIGKAFDFASQVNERGQQSLAQNFNKTAGLVSDIVAKQTVDSGERVQSVVTYALVAVVGLGGLILYFNRTH